MRPSRRTALALACCIAATGAGCASFQQPGEPLGARLGPGARYVHTRSGRAIYAEVHGPEHGARTVLFVHGFASNHDVWATVEPALRPAHRTVNVDLPGFGWSSRAEGDYSPVALAHDLADVLDDVSATEPVDVVAHSWGSSVALALALEHPDRVRRVVLVGAWIYDEQIPPFFRWARAPGVGEVLFSAFYRERPDDRFPAAFEDPSFATQEMVDAIERSFDRPGTSRAALAAARGQCFLQLEARYHTIRQPVLLLWGAHDGVALPRFGERLARDLPDARLRMIPATGHFPMIEAAAETRRSVLGFLDEAAP